MKENSEGFLESLLNAIKGSAKFIDNLMVRESMSKKSLRMAGIDPDRVYAGFKNLERRGLILDNKREYKLTKKGREWLIKAHLRHLKLRNRDGKWDRKWRVVIFDIPQSMHGQRDWFRKKLKYLGFYMLQKSVFILPYPCEEELGYICSNLNISDHVDVVVANSIGSREEEMKKHFEL